MDSQVGVSDKWLEVYSKLSKLLVHDLKNPISALSANLSYLNRALADESEDLRGAVTDSILALEMLLRFSDNLQLIARLENREKMEVSEVSLDALVNSVVSRSKAMAESAGVIIEIDEPVDSVTCFVQYRYAELAIDNLIMCAFRHSPRGGRVVISAVQQDENIRIAVRDQGYPIAEQFVPTLFTPEGQAEAKNHKDSRYGRGLGLYAVGLAARALGGRVDVISKGNFIEFALVIPQNVLGQ